MFQYFFCLYQLCYVIQLLDNEDNLPLIIENWNSYDLFNYSLTCMNVLMNTACFFPEFKSRSHWTTCFSQPAWTNTFMSDFEAFLPNNVVKRRTERPASCTVCSNDMIGAINYQNRFVKSV